MLYAEIVVNVPIRRTFGRRYTDPPPPDSFETLAGDWGGVAGEGETRPSLQAFHYHIPPELEREVVPGHLVWVPFGAREVQGFVVSLTDRAPVETKAILRLARPEPVLTRWQIELATWIAHYYVAPLAETIRLFLPPGLLERKGGGAGIRVKRELQIALIVDPERYGPHLEKLARTTQRSVVLSYLLGNAEQRFPVADLLETCGLKTQNTIKTLLRNGLVRVEDGAVSLARSQEESQESLAKLRGVDKYLRVLDVLETTGVPLWKSQLYAQVETSLGVLRDLERVGLIEMSEQVRFRDPLAGRIYPRSRAPVLTGEQALVWQHILERGYGRVNEQGEPVASRFLIHGVTGSGKTEIYLRAIDEALTRGRQAVVLVPEIALTPQTVARFAGRFPGHVTVVHSGLNAGERYDVWRKVRSGEFDIVVGPRSALFAPLPRLGLIVIDEEHEPSYKQDAEVWGGSKVYYDARTVAWHLAVLTRSVLIAGSATPSLEAYYGAQQDVTELLEMPRRVLGHQAPSAEDSGTATAYAELPPVEVVDMRQELRAGNRSVMSRSLQAELHATLDSGEQAIFFLNRRGTSTFVMCRDCGDVQRCSRCEVPLTYHERANVLICHHCNRRYPIPSICPECSSKRIKYFGSGTQRIEELVQQVSPRAWILRWDADTTSGRGSHEAILARFIRHEADILVGTQMIAKGLDLPLVTLVGVISADVGLYLPDFRSGERSFQLLTQVAGRAGRSRRGGRVVIQTYTPDHYVIQAATQHDYAAFYARELGYRHEYDYPPVRRMARLVYWDKNRDKAEEMSEQMAETLRLHLQELGIPVVPGTLVGPAPAFFARYRSYYRWQILLRADDPGAVLRALTFPFGWRVDIDPVAVL